METVKIMKKANKISLLAAALSVLAMMFLIDSQAAAQVSNNAVSISFKKPPPLPHGYPEPWKNWWFQHAFGVGEYFVDVSAASPLPLVVGANQSSVFLSGKDATAVVFTGNTGEICGDALPYNKYFCLPLKEGNAITKLDIFAKIREVKSKKIRPTGRVTIWQSYNFTGKNLDLGTGTNDIGNLDFGNVNAVWVPDGYWAMFCMELSQNGKLCGPGRGFRGGTYYRDSQYVQPGRVDSPRRKFRYVLVGTGEPPREPVKIKIPKPEVKPLSKQKTKVQTKRLP